MWDSDPPVESPPFTLLYRSGRTLAGPARVYQARRSKDKIMNRWIRTALLSYSLIGALALVPSAVAFASDAAHGEAGPHGHKGHGGGPSTKERHSPGRDR